MNKSEHFIKLRKVTKERNSLLGEETWDRFEDTEAEVTVRLPNWTKPIDSIFFNQTKLTTDLFFWSKVCILKLCRKNAYQIQWYIRESQEIR